MIRRPKTLALTCSLLASLIACQEKAAAPNPSTSTGTGTGKDQGTGTGDDNLGGDNDTGDSGSFDLCSSLKSSSQLNSVKSFVTELCDGKFDEMRKSANMFKSGDSPKIKLTEDVQSNSSSFHILTALTVSSKPQEYFDMVRLQYIKPSSFKDNFTVADSVQLDVQDSSQTSATFEYTNSAIEDSIVKYDAKTTFVTIKKNQAYAFVTTFIESKETLENLKGLIVINKKSDTETEVFSISDQTYNNSGDPATCKSKVTRELGNEQKRSFTNGQNASKATSLLSGN